LQEATNILQDIELSRLYLSTRSSWQPATNIQWSCTAKPVQTNRCKSQIDAENRQQSKESSLHLDYRKEKLSSYSDGLLNIQIAEENKAPNSLMFLSRTKKIKIKTHSLTLHDGSPMAFTLHHKKYKTEENTKNLTSKKRFRNQTKTKQNKTEFKKRKKSFFRRYKIAFSTTYKRKWRSHMITIPGPRLFTHLVSGRGSTEDEGVREV
jgi:hypothetical protein